MSHFQISKDRPNCAKQSSPSWIIGQARVEDNVNPFPLCLGENPTAKYFDTMRKDVVLLYAVLFHQEFPFFYGIPTMANIVTATCLAIIIAACPTPPVVA
jgi:hypothetical protein